MISKLGKKSVHIKKIEFIIALWWIHDDSKIGPLLTENTVRSFVYDGYADRGEQGPSQYTTHKIDNLSTNEEA